MRNVYDFEKHPWFVDMAQGNLTNELLEYFALSDDYRKKVASHSMLAVGNHLGMTTRYSLEAKKLIDRINTRLKETE